ncbi:MAG: N-acyl homoserine lactonase family protein [Solirubrobacteraceae bacterium]
MSDVRLYFFQCGSIDMPLRNANLGEGGGGERLVTPVQWYLVTHPRGNAVIDGGNAPEVAIDAKKHWGAITEVSNVMMAPEDAILPTMAAHGFDPADVRWIVQTHLHIDHTGALAVIDSFPNAEVLVRRTEHDFAHSPPSYAALGYAKADYDKPGVPWVLLEDSEDGYDLYGDGTLRLWWTPGHTPGHASIEVNLPSGQTFFLAQDAGNNLDHIHERKMPAFNVSLADAIDSIRRIRRLAWRRDATIVAGHDAGQWATIRKAPEFYD